MLITSDNKAPREWGPGQNIPLLPLSAALYTHTHVQTHACMYIPYTPTHTHTRTQHTYTTPPLHIHTENKYYVS